MVEFGPGFSAETVKACAAIDLHMMADENALRSDRYSSPDLGENVGVCAGVHVYNPRLFEIVGRRPTYVGLALWFFHHPAWVEGHTGGSWFTPTVHPC